MGWLNNRNNCDKVCFRVINAPEFKSYCKEQKRVDDIIRGLEKIQFEISFVISGWGLKNGYVAFGLEEDGCHE